MKPLVPMRRGVGLFGAMVVSLGVGNKCTIFAFTISPKLYRVSVGSVAWKYNNGNKASPQKTVQSLSYSSSRRMQSVALASNSASNDNNDDNNGTPEERTRPEWAYPWMPSWIFTMSARLQIATILLFYVFHLTILCQRHIVFPFQLIPNDFGQFASIGWDSLAGFLVVLLYSAIRKRQQQVVLVQQHTAAATTTTATTRIISNPTLPKLLDSPKFNAPWKLPTENVRHRVTSLFTIGLLVRTYFQTATFSMFWEDALYNLAGLGVPMTTPIFRSGLVLLGHLSWLIAGTCILRWGPRPPRFFGAKNVAEVGDEEAKNVGDKPSTTSYRWFQSSLKENFAWWVIGGYFVSSWAFNVADTINQFVLADAAWSMDQSSTVAQLLNPENNDRIASVIGFVAPCLTAPWWEEILYRGFLLAALTNGLGYRLAVIVQGLVFSLHHASITGAIPLALLGWLWAILYTKSQNLMTVILVHCLWNSRIFLGAWLGL